MRSFLFRKPSSITEARQHMAAGVGALVACAFIFIVGLLLNVAAAVSGGIVIGVSMLVSGWLAARRLSKSTPEVA